ncbi:Uncharacterized protein HZ326_11187 [Fusarium oxysporum f. sp. albedinis]|nr:Uncharacterized protein HZ326_11187 [Fusarium oxysporum f. sp. albedinis]
MTGTAVSSLLHPAAISYVSFPVHEYHIPWMSGVEFITMIPQPQTQKHRSGPELWSEAPASFQWHDFLGKEH